MKRLGLTLMEEQFCQLIALGKTATDAYCDAFGRAPTDERGRKKVTVSASKLSKRPDIASRIVEAKGEQKRRDREKWQQQGDEIANHLFSAISQTFDWSDEDGKPMILNKDVLKGIEVLAKMKGLNAPEEQVLKNGGMAEDANIPKGVQVMDEKDLMNIIEVEGKSKSPLEGDKTEGAKDED